jgi:thiol-disulfide isomerase/thioredoxin
LQGEPKPWEGRAPEYLTGEVSRFVRTVPSGPLPNVRLQTLASGEATRLPKWADGRVMVVNLWATWCAPCLEELPTLAALQEQLGDEVHVVTVAMEGGDPARTFAFLERVGASDLTALQDPKLALMGSYGGDLALPLTVVYDSRGREVGRLAGSADWASEESRRLLSAIAGGAYPPGRPSAR